MHFYYNQLTACDSIPGNGKPQKGRAKWLAMVLACPFQTTVPLDS